MPETEAFSRAVIDAQLADQKWKVTDATSVRFEYTLSGGLRADYLLCDRNGRGLAVIEAKKSSINAADAADQAKRYAELANVPFIFLANGKEILFWDWQQEAHPHAIHTFFSRADLERRTASRALRADPTTIPIDRRIVERDYQVNCIDTLSRAIKQGQRKLLVEMATGTGKTRTAAALIKRLFDANRVTRVLFLVDRIPLALQTEDAFAEHLRDYPCYTLRAGRRFQDEKRITVTTLQSMVNLYHEYSSGYFDLIISDECHRSIYGKWRRVLEHFDGIQIGLTATPCIAAPTDSNTDDDKLFVRDTLRFFELSEPTFRYGIKQATAEGHLVGYQIYKAKTVKTAKADGFEVARNEIQWDALDQRTRADLEGAFTAAANRKPPKATITVDPNALERRFTIPERNLALVREFKSVMDTGYMDGNGLRRKPLIGKTIVFAVTKRHAETLARMFDAEFAHLKPNPQTRYADYVVSGTGTDDTQDGIAKIRAFRKLKFPQAPQVLVSVNMLDTGFDCPEVVNLVFARYTASPILYRQMIGRGTRKAKDKPIFTVFDFVGVSDAHQDDGSYAEVGTTPPSKPGPNPLPRELVTLDTDDAIDPTTRAWVTYDEDGNVVFLPPDELKAQELGARFESWLVEQTLTPDQERWLHLIESQIRSNASVYKDFSVDHLEQQPFIARGGKRKAAEAFGGPEALDRTLHHIQQAVFSATRTTH